MKALRHIFLTEWQLHAELADLGVPRSWPGGVVKSTAQSTGTTPLLCPRDTGRVIGEPRRFCSSIIPERKGTVISLHRGKILVFFIVHEPTRVCIVKLWQIILNSAFFWRTIWLSKKILFGQDNSCADMCLGWCRFSVEAVTGSEGEICQSKSSL